jgi:methanogenic corrinoid protein MtbC1
MADTTPMYNLKAVMHEVGISAATLRAWELRYGLPKPQRTSGGHRLYSRQDIDLLKWLVARQAEGLSISHAVELWKAQKPARQGDYLPSGRQVIEPVAGESTFDELRQQWVMACIAFDDMQANRVLDQAFSLAAPETICVEVLQKGLVHIGQLWYRGESSVQQEHFASAIAARRLNSLLQSTVPPSRTGRIIVACPPGEAHDFILLIVSFFLRRAGWDVVFLGANVPLQDLNATVQATSPILVISAAQTLNSAASLRVMSESLAQQGIPLAYGGSVFSTTPAVTRCISGYYMGSDIQHIAQVVEDLLFASPTAPAAQPLSPVYSFALERFQLSKALIASYVCSELWKDHAEKGLITIAVDALGDLIASALALGDIHLLDPHASWLDGLLQNHGYQHSLLTQLYSAYRQAVLLHLAQDGSMIVFWLDSQLSTPGN